MELVELKLKAVLVDLEATYVQISPRFFVNGDDFVMVFAFQELGKREKKLSTRINRTRRALPGTGTD